MKNKTEKNSSRLIYSFEAEPDNSEILKQVQAGGVHLKAFINAAIREHAKSALMVVSFDMRKTADRIEKLSGELMASGKRKVVDAAGFESATRALLAPILKFQIKAV